MWPEFLEVRPQAVSSRFKTAAKRAGLSHIERLHDLRHGFCSRLAQANVPTATIKAMAGHKSLVTTERYACHLPQGATKAAIAALEGHEKTSQKKQRASG